MVAVHRLLLVPSLIAALALPAASSSHRLHLEPVRAGLLRVPAPTRPVSYAGVGAVVSAPPADATPVLTQPDVVRLIAGDGFAQTVSGGSRPSTISLVMYENLFGVEHPGRPDTPSAPRQLAWLVTSTSKSIRQLGSRPLSRSPVLVLPKRPLVVCTAYVAISASTGADLDGFSMCDPAK